MGASSASQRTHDVKTTLNRRCFNIVCQLEVNYVQKWNPLKNDGLKSKIHFLNMISDTAAKGHISHTILYGPSQAFSNMRKMLRFRFILRMPKVSTVACSLHGYIL